MIPVSLTIKGLYSYQKEQIIEFGKLLEGQLFGIFGAVGSGKSSILEAMTFALYGQSERLDRNDNRNYNMMNLKSDELLIDFIFRNFDEREYRFTVRGKRHGKDFDKVNTFDRAAYLREGDTWLPLESSNADQILGLSYDNFRRTIIIPQGKFQEFLQLGDKDRTNMLKEIFQLDKYEFFYQTAGLEKKNNESLQNLKGQLVHYERISPELIAERESLVSALSDNLALKRTELSIKEEELRKQTELKRLFEELAIRREHLKKLLEHEQDYSNRAKKIRDYEFCLHNFKEGLNRKKGLQNDITQRISLIEESNKILDRLNAQLAELQNRAEEIKLDLQKQEERRLLTDDYRLIISLKEVQEELQKQKQRLEQGKPHIDKALADKNSSEQRIAELKEFIRDQKAVLPDLAVLSAVRQWHAERRSIDLHSQKLRGDMTEVEDQMAALPEQLLPLLAAPVFASLEKGKPFSFYQEHITQARAENRRKLEVLASQIAHFRLQLKLGEFAEQMSKGGACLLCGSEHHPNPLVVEDVNEHLIEAGKREQECIKFDQSCEKILAVLHNLQQTELSLQQRSAALASKLKEEDLKQQDHLLKFVWQDFEPADESQLEKAFIAFEAGNKKLQELEEQLEHADRLCLKSSSDYEKYKKEIDKIGSVITAKEAELQILARQLKLVDLKDFEQVNASELQTRIRELNAEIEAINKEAEQLAAKIDENKSARFSLLERVSANRDMLLKEELQIAQIKSNLQECFEKSEFASWQEVELILDEVIDLDTLKTELSVYKQQVHTAEQLLAQLEEQCSGKSFEAAVYETLSSELKKLRDEVQQFNDQYVQEKAGLDKQKADLEQKLRLQIQLDKLEKRAANLNTMKQLFKGSGFVNYVSSVYLHNLCEAANERFYKLTRQSLRLEVTERNEFQVRDFLNNGKVRNVKTLSGGQTFQASLSLALALAESVQQQNKSKQNFFFLDEGFGSLDKESLQVAFETLKSLRKENRKVGIISHVEELQQEIDVYLIVTNDHFSGSRIAGSWEK